MPENKSDNTRDTEHWSLPEYDTGTHESPDLMLRRLAEDGVRRRYGNAGAACVDRLKSELKTIEKHGLAPFFLILWDLAQAAEAYDAPFYLFGTIADSLVAYALGLSHVDPLRYHLVFERLTGSIRPKQQVPVVDCGTSGKGKYVLDDHLAEHYGEAAPPFPWLRYCHLPEVDALHQCETRLRTDQGVRIDWSTIRLDDAAVYDALREMLAAAEFGLPFLQNFDSCLWQACPPKNFEDLMAAFTLMWPGPDQYQDEYIRRKAGRERPECLVDALEPILRCTAGLCLYQEQFMEIYHVLTRRSLAEGYHLRRILAMRKTGEMEQWKNDFMRHSTINGIQPDTAQKVWDYLYRAAPATFNKAHTATCCLIPYRLAWIDVHHLGI